MFLFRGGISMFLYYILEFVFITSLQNICFFLKIHIYTSDICRQFQKLWRRMSSFTSGPNLNSSNQRMVLSPLIISERLVVLLLNYQYHMFRILNSFNPLFVRRLSWKTEQMPWRNQELLIFWIWWEAFSSDWWIDTMFIVHVVF